MSTTSAPYRTLVIGCGDMGSSHARAYASMDECEIVGLVSRGEQTRTALNDQLGGGHELFSNAIEAMDATQPDLVSINTYPDTHEELALHAIGLGAHVFMEKPMSTTVAGAQRIVDGISGSGRKMVIGYILRHHPSWIRFVDIARTLGKPLVMRMNLNQQSSGAMWDKHKALMHSMSPIVDCGVHYVDVMCQMTRATPVRVSAVGTRLTDEIDEAMYNYGQLQVAFDDGSVGWYEAGWGPMMSETAFFVKDVVGPKGSVSIAAQHGESHSDDTASHTKTESLRMHHAALNDADDFAAPDETIDMSDEPDHDELCAREQRFLLKAIREDIDLADHWADAVNSLRIVVAADESVRTGKTVTLDDPPL